MRALLSLLPRNSLRKPAFQTIMSRGITAWVEGNTGFVDLSRSDASPPKLSALEVDQVLVGAKGRYQLKHRLSGTHRSDVFKAEVLSDAKIRAKW